MGNRDGNAVGGYNDECACMRAEVLVLVLESCMN